MQSLPIVLSYHCGGQHQAPLTAKGYDAQYGSLFQEADEPEEGSLDIGPPAVHSAALVQNQDIMAASLHHIMELWSCVVPLMLSRWHAVEDNISWATFATQDVLSCWDKFSVASLLSEQHSVIIFTEIWGQLNAFYHFTEDSKLGVDELLS